MMTIPFVMLLAGMLTGCTSGPGAGAETDFADSLLSTPALMTYALIAGVGLALLWAKMSRKTQHKAPVRQPRPISPSSAPVSLQEQEPEDRIFQLEEALKQCRYEQEQLKRELAEAEQLSLTVVPERPYPVRETGDDEPPAQPVPVTTLYYLQPSAEGRFLQTSKVAAAEEALYIFHCREDNPDVASFSFMDRPRNTFLAVQNEPTWILPACERSNLPNDDTASIRTDIPGEAVWKEGVWEIIRKAKITYL